MDEDFHRLENTPNVMYANIRVTGQQWSHLLVLWSPMIKMIEQWEDPVAAFMVLNTYQIHVDKDR